MIRVFLLLGTLLVFSGEAVSQSLAETYRQKQREAGILAPEELQKQADIVWLGVRPQETVDAIKLLGNNFSESCEDVQTQAVLFSSVHQDQQVRRTSINALNKHPGLSAGLKSFLSGFLDERGSPRKNFPEMLSLAIATWDSESLNRASTHPNHGVRLAVVGAIILKRTNPWKYDSSRSKREVLRDEKLDEILFRLIDDDQDIVAKEAEKEMVERMTDWPDIQLSMIAYGHGANETKKRLARKALAK